MSFGRLFSKDSDDVLGMDCSDHRDAPYLHLHGHVPPNESDSAQTRTVKDSANRALAGFEVEARVHQLTLHLDRGEVAGRLGEEQLLCPRFSLDESRLSFRIERHTESKVERVSLQAAGFEWQEAKDGNGYLCWREFWTWDRLREFFGGPSASGGGLASLLVTGRERLLGQVVSHATKLVLDHSIESIEESLDQEIARLVGEALERYSTARDVLAARLHKGLF
ncbi:MAG: hypothetical protein GY811_21190 [Myxococcales bacterium]|nr:hypothetical protein [Myxococcales bacterium]